MRLMVVKKNLEKKKTADFVELSKTSGAQSFRKRKTSSLLVKAFNN